MGAGVGCLRCDGWTGVAVASPSPAMGPLCSNDPARDVDHAVRCPSSSRDIWFSKGAGENCPARAGARAKSPRSSQRFVTGSLTFVAHFTECEDDITAEPFPGIRLLPSQRPPPFSRIP